MDDLTWSVARLFDNDLNLSFIKVALLIVKQWYLFVIRELFELVFILVFVNYCAWQFPFKFVGLPLVLLLFLFLFDLIVDSLIISDLILFMLAVLLLLSGYFFHVLLHTLLLYEKSLLLVFFFNIDMAVTLAKCIWL